MIAAVLIRLWLRFLTGLLWAIDRCCEVVANSVTWCLYQFLFRWFRGDQD